MQGLLSEYHSRLEAALEKIESQQRDNDSLQRLGIDRLDEMEKVFLRGFPFPPAASFRSTV